MGAVRPPGAASAPGGTAPAVTRAAPPAVRDPGAGASFSQRQIAGMSALKGLMLYGATLTFAAFYAYFIVEIADASSGQPPTFNGAMVAAAAALAGVLGSAFALYIGVPTEAVNQDLTEAIAREGRSPQKRTQLRKLLSLEPAAAGAASWPLTFGIWVYAVIASAVAITYFLNQNETPDPIKALAVAFAGYVLALVTAAYGLASKR